MHFKGILALLFAEVPHFDYAIDTSGSDLETSVEPSALDEGGGVALQSRKTLSRANIPHLTLLVS